MKIELRLKLRLDICTLSILEISAPETTKLLESTEKKDNQRRKCTSSRDYRSNTSLL